MLLPHHVSIQVGYCYTFPLLLLRFIYAYEERTKAWKWITQKTFSLSHSLSLYSLCPPPVVPCYLSRFKRSKKKETFIRFRSREEEEEEDNEEEK